LDATELEEQSAADVQASDERPERIRQLGATVLGGEQSARAIRLLTEMRRDAISLKQVRGSRQAPFWDENMKSLLDFAINNENIGRPCSHY
jgi:hypothetical protein